MDSAPFAPPEHSLESRIAWFAAWLSAALAAVALAPSTASQLAVGLAGAALSVTLASRFLDRATPFAAALLTITAAAVSIAAVIRLSGLPWETGISWSQAGGVGRPTARLFTTTALCFGAGVLASGRLMARAGARRGELGGRAYRLASALPWVSAAGFAVLALAPVGGDPRLAAAHNLASWAALGSFWAGMVATPWQRALSPALRVFSAAAAVTVFAVWLPNGLRFMRLYEGRPISMLVMEVVVFPLCFIWFGWLAREWRDDSL